MGIRFACHGCHRRLNVKSELAGRRGKCPHCGTKFRVPTDDQPYADPPARPASAAAPASEAAAASAPATAEAERQPADEAAASESAVAVATEEPARTHPPAAPPAPPEPAAATVDPISQAPDAVWYVRPTTGGQYGPATGEVMRDWITENRVGPAGLVWRDGWEQWRTAADVFPELAGGPPALAPAPAAPGAAAAPPQPGKQRRDRRAQRNVVVALLVALSILLVAALVAVLLWPENPGS